MAAKQSKGAKPHFFITGTDTGAGKTVVCAALARCLMAGGMTVSVVKPFQTGCLPGVVCDSEFAHRAMEKSFTPSVSSPCRLREPLAPMMAARIEGAEIDVAKVMEVIGEQSRTHDAVIVEGAGGLMVPISEGYFMADFAADLGFKTVIAARAGLGTLNHTILTVEAARARGLEVAGVVICGYPSPAGVCEETNLAFLRTEEERVGKVAGVIPFIEGLDVEDGAAEGLAREDCRRFFTAELFGVMGEES
ncbi:MAG: dethiobiotin synthase [Candidatus Dadabacteria bacterium]|nr:dethiobiotin synthase [Candidatus Dadabacteria bacterium]